MLMQLLNMFPITKTMISQCYVCMASLQGEFVMCIVMSLTMSCDVKCDWKHTHKGAELRLLTLTKFLPLNICMYVWLLGYTIVFQNISKAP